jgi:hypothetical protein
MRRRRIDELRRFLERQEPGPIADTDSVIGLLSDCWNCFEGNDATNTGSAKLGRMELPIWNPLYLEFLMERHGQTVLGSTRATAYQWRLNILASTAEIVEGKPRQLRPMAKRLDVEQIAKRLAQAIIAGRADPWFTIMRNGCIRLNIGQIVPAAYKQTTSGRRTRLRRYLDALLAPHGWRSVRANVYKKVAD